MDEPRYTFVFTELEARLLFSIIPDLQGHAMGGSKEMRLLQPVKRKIEIALQKGKDTTSVPAPESPKMAMIYDDFFGMGRKV